MYHHGLWRGARDRWARGSKEIRLEDIMMRKFNITVNGRTYEVEVEEVTSGAVLTAPAPSPKVKEERSVESPQEKAPQESRKDEPEKKIEAPVETKASEGVKVPEVPDGAETILSPMPGTILSVNVKPGDMVKRGDVLLILEAMKMENEIMASHDGKVLRIGVQSGASVNTGDELVVIS